MSEAELHALLRLRCVPGLGDVRLGRLLRQAGSALALLEAPLERFGPHGALRDAPATLARAAAVLRMVERLGLKVYTLLGRDYPERLRALHDAPVLLFARGEPALLERRGVAVVGTRSPTDYGTSVTESLVSGLARADVVIWSGGARGIDGTAHRTALAEGGTTVAVLGCGIDVAYPPEHEPLFEEIAERGLLLSEFLPGELPSRHTFPRRNRILGHMPAGVLVVEAREKGGALITAEHAWDSCSVMAVPGPIGRPTSWGPNRLIQDGARLVLEARDVLEELRFPVPERTEPVAAEVTPPCLPPVQRRMCRVLRPEGEHVDVLARRARLGAAEALETLLELELAGQVMALGGNRFRQPPPRRPRAPRPEPAQPPA